MEQARCRLVQAFPFLGSAVYFDWVWNAIFTIVGLNAMSGMTGQSTPAQDQVASSAPPDEEAEIKALLTPGQLAAYPDFKQSEIITSADTSAKAQLMMTSEMDLSQEQQDKVHSALYQLDLNQASAPSPNQTAIAQARASGNYTDVINFQIEVQQQTLENELMPFLASSRRSS
jgi:hypothetical protein